ncbi:Chitinase 2 [Cryomyces antarcticus]|uniref:Chitinase 2 n=2 Tax=Cryomyces antarcticus TaxID=329879 RepID=A0ABR0M0Z1_9PEZI|nr:Chitinase 2 [Cryomyces antarcticus]KAK5257128.1 Chitinase 2 [Cryomyces antarcticus]
MRSPYGLISTTIAATSLLSSAVAAFDASSPTNVAVYWGQGSNQARLVETCKNSAIDIVIVSFLNVFPDQGPGGFPGTNFGNACGGSVYKNNGVDTDLLSDCPNIGADISACQTTYGKKVLLSLGGGAPLDYYIANDASATSFADFLWGAFGPQTSAWTTANKPRPFGSASVDGFDYDIESEISPAPANAPDYQTRGYATMINYLKNTLFPQDTSKSYYISGAPQCVLPDAHLSSVIAASWFDFVFVQFYNTPYCSARAGINHAAGTTTNDISYDGWANSSSLNPNVRISIGLVINMPF